MPLTMQPRIKSHWSATGRRETEQDYYMVRPAPASYDDYWGKVVDPDGVTRDRLSESERLRYLDDIADELWFIRDLHAGIICDVGCGPGWLLRELDSEQWERMGVEIAPQAIAELRRWFIPHVHSTTELDGGRYDVVFCHHVIEHMSDPLNELAHMRRILRPGGWLIIGTPDFGSPCAKRFGENYRMLHDPTHCSLFDLESMHRFLRDGGFVVRDVRFPFPQRFATPETFARWGDVSKVSPAWPGNWMTFYAQRTFGGNR